MANIKITYKDNVYEYAQGVSLLDISKDFEGNYKKEIIVATVDNRLTSLEKKISKDSAIDFFDVTNILGRRTYIRGLCFLFVKAVKEVLKCDVKIMYFVGKGIYCELLTNNLISEVTVEKIKIKMRELNEANLPINKLMVSRVEAIDYFSRTNQKDKASSLRYISNSTISLYRLDDSLDYFYGVLPCKTGYINNFNLKYIDDNKVILLPPISYESDEKLKFEKNDKIIDEIKVQNKYLENIKINFSSDLNKLISTGEYGDVIRMSENIQNSQLLNIADNISKNKDIKLVLLTGPTASGKTTVSKKITSYLKWKGYEPILISISDFYLDLKDRVLNEDGNSKVEKIDMIDTNQFNKKVSELLEGKEVILPKYNFEEGKQQLKEENKVRLLSNGIIVIEGIHAFNEQLTEMIPDKNKYKIYISPITPLNIDNHNLFKETDNRLLREIVVNNKINGKSASETLKTWEQIRLFEEDLIIPYRKQADAIFNSSLVYELGVLKTYAEPLLFSVLETDKNYDNAQRLINIFRMILGIPSEEVPSDSIIREFIGQSCFKKYK